MDKRHDSFRKEYGKNFDWKFFTNVFQLQGILGVVLSFPFLAACMNPDSEIYISEYIALALFAIGFAGESLADYQLNTFKLDQASKGGFAIPVSGDFPASRLFF